MRGKQSLFRLWGVLTLWLKEARSPTTKHIRTYAALFASTKTRRVTSALIPVVFALAVIGLVQFYNRPEEIVVASHGCSGTTTITVNTTWSTNQCLGDVIIRNGATLTINGGITADLASLSVGSDSPAENGFITAKGDTGTGEGIVLNVDGTVYVRSGSSINADGQGYLGGRSGDVNGKGPGGAITDGTTTAGGGGYGGVGGNGTGSNAGGAAYGSLAEPVDLGSGGGFVTSCCSNNGGDGGGAIKINAPFATVTVNGTITANGTQGGGGCCSYAGGGSGGSIWIISNTLAGSGTVRANGGAGGVGGIGDSNNGGAGAGGRVQLTFATDSSTITKQAFDGGNNAISRRGAAGTISTSTELLIANNTSTTWIPPVATPLTGTLSYANTTFKDYVYVTLASGVSYAGGTTLIQNNVRTTLLGNSTAWSGGSLTVQTGTNTINVPKNISSEPNFSSITIGTGTLQHDSHTTTHTYSLTLSTSGAATITGTINVDDKGYAGGTSGSADGKGPGGGLDGSSNDAPGAGHGGTGGNGATVSGGGSYGNLSSPTDLGSGGGGTSSSSFNNGGNGGGAVKINAPSGTVTINGTISAGGSTGSSNCCNYAGGGSGGSVWIIANQLAGSGTVRANGGAGGSGGAGDSSNGGAGAGGRIQLTFSSDTSSLTRQAFDGGNNAISRRAAAGTISTSAELVIANNTSTTWVPAVATPLSGALNYGSTTIKDYVHVTLAGGTNYSGGTTLVQNNTKTTLLASNTVWSGGALTVQTGTNTINVPKSVATEPNFSSITIGTGTLNHNDHSTAHDYSVILASAGNVTVTGNITLDGLGFDGGRSGDVNGKGPGGTVTNGTTTAGGAGYGGAGSNGTSPNVGGGAYGSFVQPTDLGSGGGGASASSFNNGGDGGGALKINAPSGTVTVNGTISASGSAAGAACCNYAGGGSGGSIWIIANQLAGSGTVRVNGGQGGVGGIGEGNNGGAGAGGRIQLTYGSDTSTITKQAFDGGNNGANRRGAAGTISTSSGLTIANSTSVTVMPVVSTPFSGSLSYSTTTIKDYVYVTFLSGANISTGTTTIENNTRTTLLADDSVWTGGALTVQTGTNTINVKPTITARPLFSSINFVSGNIYHDDHTATDLYHLILSASGNITVGTSINLTGLGYSGGATSTTGNGTGPGIGSGGNGGGGAHGGAGGTGSGGGGAGGAAYGSAAAPVTLGSGGGGGGAGAGGDGGGAIQLIAGGTIAVNSSIVVTGNPGSASCCTYGGGGAGGSIFLAADTISGSGALTAAGGNGGGGSGGCGAGGRIARHYRTSTYSGTVSVAKGTGSCSVGQDGTNQTVGAVTDLVVTGISSPRTAGVTSSVVVEARDGSNNRNYAYTKSVTFTSTDAQATLPGNYTFTITDAGQATIPGVILKTAGTQTVTVDQTDDGTVDGTHANITVNPAAAATLAVAGLTSPVSAGTSGTVVVTARDQYANVATGYTGTVAFSSSDAAASLPVNYVFTLGDAGTKTFTDNVTFKTVGVHSVTATDTVTSSITGLQSNIAVTHGPVTKFTVTANPTSIQSGSAVSLTATAYDAYNNVGTGYTGTVAVNSSDLTATLPANSTFTLANSGVKTITGLVLRSAGTQTATVFQVGAQAIQGVSGPITVVAASSSGNNGAGNGNSGSTGSSSGQNNAVKKITFEVTINPEGSGNFTGSINQEVEGAVLNVTVSGVVTGGQVIGYVQGTYGNVPVSGVLSGTVENNAIGSATITLFSTANKSFIKRVVLGGAVQRSERDPAPCQIRGTITTTIDGQPFTGEVRLTINDDGSLEGTAKGKLGKRTVSGTFYAPRYSAEVIEGSLTIVRQNNSFAETVAVVGSLDPGEIQVLEAKNCRIKAEIDFEAPPVPGTSEETDPTPGSGEVVIVVGDSPISGSSEQEVPVVGEVQATNTSTETEPAVGTLDVQVNGIILQPTEVGFTPNTNALEALAVALVVVGAATTIPLIPQVQTGLMTSSIRGTSILNWVFFGRTPSRRRRRWGVIRDAVTGVPVAGVQVLLVDVQSNEILKQMRTDRTGRFGFVLGQSAPVERYRLVINDPMYEGYTTEEFDNDN